MTEEVGPEREDERHPERAQEREQSERAEQIASEQVGVGSGPGRPPASGTGPRGKRLSDPPTGRFDEARASQGLARRAADELPGDQPAGPGDEPTDGSAAAGEAGVDESGASRPGGR